MCLRDHITKYRNKNVAGIPGTPKSVRSQKYVHPILQVTKSNEVPSWYPFRI